MPFGRTPMPPRAPRASWMLISHQRQKATPLIRRGFGSRGTIRGRVAFIVSIVAFRGACWRAKSAPRVGPVRVSWKRPSTVFSAGDCLRDIGGRSRLLTRSSGTTFDGVPTESGMPQGFLENEGTEVVSCGQERRVASSGQPDDERNHLIRGW